MTFTLDLLSVIEHHLDYI